MSHWITSGPWYVYKISNVINNKLYIGITCDHQKRWKQHLYNACSVQVKKQNNQPLYIDMCRYGIDKFDMSIIEKGPDMNQMFKREQYWIDTLSTKFPDGYNLTSGYTPINVSDFSSVGGAYSVYTYTNSLTGEMFSIKAGANDQWVRYLRDARSESTKVAHIVNAIRSVWKQGGKVIIRKLYTNVDIGRACQVERELLIKYHRKLSSSNSSILA